MEHQATYSPEDNKLRIYPAQRLDDELGEEYAAFKAAGYKWASKQECFVCPRWTPTAEDWALRLCGEIGDEDYSPEERSADRAERFEGYRDKRRGEAHGHADTFDAGPSAFGHQNRGRAERQAARHDKHRTRAVSQWSKAEYWQQRTAGVIANALFKSSPGVRRGRLIRLETELRRYVRSPRWAAHYALRMEYERAMIAAEGGMVAEVEIVPGGWFGRAQVLKVNKSPATGRVVSVGIWGPHPWKTNRDGTPKMGTQSVNIERLGADAYRAPTDEELAAFKASQAAAKKERKATTPKAPPLINPTDSDAERLQAIWNAGKRADDAREVLRLTQAQYSANSKGAYARCETVEVTEQLKMRRSTAMGGQVAGRVVVFNVRQSRGRVIIITDKPQKPLPFDAAAEVLDAQPSVEKLLPRMGELIRVCGLSWLPDGEDRQLLDDAQYVGWAFISSMSQFGFTDAGHAAAKQYQSSVTMRIELRNGAPVRIIDGIATQQAALFA